MATEYRELNAVIRAIWSVKISPDAEIFNALKRAIEEEVKNIEPANVQPIVHSAWVVTDDLFGETCHCPKCGFFMCVNEPGNGLPMIENLHLCPNCGADMRGKQDCES